MLIIAMIVVGLVLVLGPWIPGMPVLGDVNVTGKVISTALGIASRLIGWMVFVITRLYRRAKANEALVRTGPGGSQVILHGGSIVIPALHGVVAVTLEMMTLIVDGDPADGFASRDGHALNVTAEFSFACRASATPSSKLP